MPAHAAARLGRRLRDAGFTEANLDEALRGRPVSRATSGARAAASRRLTVDEPLRSLVELWYLSGPSSMAAARAAHGSLELDDLAKRGLLHGDRDQVVPDIRIVPFGELLIAHDLDGARRTPGDHVLGIGGATRTLAALTIRREVGDALDLGTGSGSQALLASDHSRRVVATDISERAAWFARLNAEMNGREGIEVSVGDAFEPVADATFDLIVSNPPFVISPERAYTFRDSGREADAISREVVQGAIERLRPGGSASVLVNWVVRDGDGATAAPTSWLVDQPGDALLITNEALDPARYAEQWVMDSSVLSPARFARALGRWGRYHERIGATAIGSGAVVVRRTEGTPRLRTLEMTTVADEGGPQLERILASFGRFSGPDDPELDRTRFAHADDHRVEQHLAYTTSAGYEAHPVTLRLAQSAGITASVPADLLEAVFLVDGARPLEAIVADLAEARVVPAPELGARIRPVFLELYERGFLVC